MVQRYAENQNSYLPELREPNGLGALKASEKYNGGARL